ncbi:MAG: hypothetical protein QXG55_04580 [Thermoplasmata archaeon]
MKECIKEWKGDEESAAEILRCFKEYGEDIYFNDCEGRLFLAREIWDNSISDLMKEISKVLKINTRDDFINLKEKYNLTMY